VISLGLGPDGANARSHDSTGDKVGTSRASASLQSGLGHGEEVTECAVAVIGEGAGSSYEEPISVR
jgi:hypothetical protein